MPSYNHHIDLTHVAGIKDVQASLEQISTSLAGTPLESLLTFTNVYVIITKQINNAIQGGGYQNPRLIEELVVSFASYYFMALNTYAEIGNLPPAWQLALPPHDRSNTTRLLLAANVHINHDLPLAMQRCNLPVEFKQDYFRTNTLFTQSFHPILASYRETNLVPRILKSILWPITAVPTFVMILVWRRRAWINYLGVTSGNTTEARLLDKTTRIARLLRILI